MYTIYRVQPSDTLLKICKNYNLTLEEILEVNPQIENPDHIEVGQPINVPVKKESNLSSLNDSESGFPKWYILARDEMEVGVKEIKGSEHNPRVLEYHQTTTLAASDDETPWCSSFVNWCIESGGHTGTKSAAARSWLKWGKNLSHPKEGCIVVLKRGSHPWQGHVGFYAGETGSHILVLGGNQRNEVNIASYSKARLLGYRWVVA